MVGQMFTILLFASCGYAALAGGQEGRWIAGLLVAAALLSLAAASLEPGWTEAHLPVLMVDIALLVALGLVAVRSRRYWPLWMTAFHLVSVSTHAARIAEPDLAPLIYFALQSFWSLPLLLVMVAGIMLDRRAALPKEVAWKTLTRDRRFDT